jgi:hypothetical protein
MTAPLVVSWRPLLEGSHGASVPTSSGIDHCRFGRLRVRGDAGSAA